MSRQNGAARADAAVDAEANEREPRPGVNKKSLTYGHKLQVKLFLFAQGRLSTRSVARICLLDELMFRVGAAAFHVAHKELFHVERLFF